jgi:putative ABC transport system substrate-binding protein
MSTNPTHPAIYTATQVAAQGLGLLTIPITARTADDLDEAFQAIRSSRCDAVLVLADPIRPTIITYAASARIPTLYQFSEYVDNGGLSYGPNLSSIWRRSARYVDKILKGANPSTLPVEQPTTFEMVLNLRAAKLLGLSFPDSVLARADRVIE